MCEHARDPDGWDRTEFRRSVPWDGVRGWHPTGNARMRLSALHRGRRTFPYAPRRSVNAVDLLPHRPGRLATAKRDLHQRHGPGVQAHAYRGWGGNPAVRAEPRNDGGRVRRRLIARVEAAPRGRSTPRPRNIRGRRSSRRRGPRVSASMGCARRMSTPETSMGRQRRARRDQAPQGREQRLRDVAAAAYSVRPDRR